MSKAPKRLPQALVDDVLTTFSPSNDYELATDAFKDLQLVATIFAQLKELFVCIDEAAEQNTESPGGVLMRISRLAALGRATAVNWEQNAEDMADRFSREINCMEIEMENTHV